MPLSERVRTGKAIEGLCLAGINDKTGHLRLTCQTNNSRFREGDYLFLHKSHPLLEQAVECVLEMDEEKRLEVFPQRVVIIRSRSAREIWIIPLPVSLPDHLLNNHSHSGFTQGNTQRFRIGTRQF